MATVELEHAATSFADAHGKRWTIRVTWGTLRRVKAATGAELIDLLDVLAGDDGADILNNAQLMLDILCACLADELEAAELTPEEFGERFESGDQVDDAIKALLEAIVDFSPPARRKTLRLTLRKLIKATEATKETASATLGNLIADPALDEALAAAVTYLGTSGIASTDSPPGPSSPTPGASPGENSNSSPPTATAPTGNTPPTLSLSSPTATATPKHIPNRSPPPTSNRPSKKARRQARKRGRQNRRR